MRSTLAIPMFALAAALLAPLSGCSRSADPETLLLFSVAQRTVDNAKSQDDYLIAAGIYQQILDRGDVSGAVLYNQGNAFLHAGKRGQAIAAYRQAKRYWPRSSFLDANLAAALGAESRERFRPSCVGRMFSWQGWLSDMELFRIATGAGVVTLALGLMRLRLRSRAIGWLALTGLAVVVLCSLSAGYRWYCCKHPACGVVISPEAVVRQGAAESCAPVLAKPIHDGTEFWFLKRRGDWLRIRLWQGQEGWVKQDSIRLY